MDTRPGSSEQELAEELVDYYSSISREAQALDLSKLPETYDRDVQPLEERAVVERLVALKKPKSHVSIDLPAKIVTATAASLGPVLTKIINWVLAGRGWPEIWKSEEVTTIPKNKTATDFDQCRGISCTSVYSKLAETFMLDMLQEEIGVSENQYGGVRGVGTEHMLAEMATKMLEDLDDNRCVVNIISIDYQKAFNRMQHAACLDMMAKKGSSSQAIRLAASFLAGRVIRTKIGHHLSSPRAAPGGAPQGTKSGNFFFTISIDQIEEGEDCQEIEQTGHQERRGRGLEEDLEDRSCDDRDFDTSFNVGRVDRRSLRRSEAIRRQLEDTVLEELPSQRFYELEDGMPPRWTKRKPWVMKYVDDVTLGGRNLLTHATSHITTNKEHRSIHAGDLEDEFKKIAANSSKVGMRINESKTQLLCVSNSINYTVESYLTVGSERIRSGEQLKILGMMFDSRGTMSAHVAELKKKFNSRIWILRHLRRANLEPEKLTKVYCALIRPVFEYCSSVYHSMITSAQSLSLERMQANALKTIYGWHNSYSTCRRLAGLPTLAERRFVNCKNFATKTAQKDRFRHWFPRNRSCGHDLRRREHYQVDFARHERLRNAPIHYMRRMMNDLERYEEPNMDDLDE